MTPITTFKDRAVALFGLGGSGVVTAKALIEGGATVAAWDDNAAAREAAAAQDIPVVDLKSVEWGGFQALVLAPGVPLTHPEPHWTVGKAKDVGIEIIGDVELFCRERAALAPGAPFICITGTNGKSTTTALIAHLLKVAGKDVQLGGNIGTAILALEPPSHFRHHVIELSSFQIDLTPSLRPTIGVMLNLTPDHIDRHGTIEGYAAVKERMVMAADLMIIGVDDDYSVAMAAKRDEESKASIRVSVITALPNGLYAEGSRIVFARNSRRIDAADLDGIGSLRGRHNAQNAAAAIGVVSSLGVSAEVIREGLNSFGGLPHRMEEIGRIGDVLFINDSKATNADSTEKALGAFEKDIFWILGGKEKEGGIEPLDDYFPRVSKAYLIGHAASVFAETLGEDVRHVDAGTLDVAVQMASEDAARHGRGVVMLSPACASYDQYKNYEQRGDHFRSLVEALPGFQPIRKGS